MNTNAVVDPDPELEPEPEVEPANAEPDVFTDDDNDDDDDDDETELDDDEIEDIIRENEEEEEDDDEDDDEEEEEGDDETVASGKPSRSKKDKSSDAREHDVNNSLFARDSANYDFNDFDEDAESDDGSEDGAYLRRITAEYKQNIITDYHPELSMHNVDEIEAMARILRDEDGNIVDPFHRTLPFVTKYEKARVIGERAKQINSGAKPFIHVEKNIIDGYVIALSEFEQKKIPFIIKRPLPFSGVEYWRLCDLEIL